MEESDARENMPGEDVTCDHVYILVQRHSSSRISSLVVCEIRSASNRREKTKEGKEMVTLETL